MFHAYIRLQPRERRKNRAVGANPRWASLNKTQPRRGVRVALASWPVPTAGTPVEPRPDLSMRLFANGGPVASQSSGVRSPKDPSRRLLAGPRVIAQQTLAKGQCHQPQQPETLGSLALYLQRQTRRHDLPVCLHRKRNRSRPPPACREGLRECNVADDRRSAEVETQVLLQHNTIGYFMKL